MEERALLLIFYIKIISIPLRYSCITQKKKISFRLQTCMYKGLILNYGIKQTLQYRLSNEMFLVSYHRVPKV